MGSTIRCDCFAGLCQGMWLFHLHSSVKIQPFLQLSLEPMAKAFCWLSFRTSKKKASAIFSGTAFCCYNMVKIQIFIKFSVGCLHSRVLLLLISLKFLKLKKRLCYRKWLILFSLKFHRDNRQNALALYSAKRKTGEKVCIFTVLWRWNSHTL